MKITKENFSSFDEGIKNEWLITNGIGGFASSTIIGANTRKYHGLLVASLYNSGMRFLVLSKLNENIIVGNNTYTLTSNECMGYIEEGFKNQESFSKRYLPEFKYKMEDVEIIKKIGMVYKENIVSVLYSVKTGNKDVILKVFPLVSYRNFHEVKRSPRFPQDIYENQTCIKLDDEYNLNMKMTSGTYNDFYDVGYNNICYRVENERGLSFIEDLYMPGVYNIKIEAKQNITFGFIASVNKDRFIDKKLNPYQIITNEENRLMKMCKIAGAKNETEDMLAIAADNFIIQKPYGTTIIAGYPWFSDWGRDTFVSLEGLTLKTNRYNDAKNVILTYSRYIENGLIPNVISENGGQSYNSVDASLWYIEAVYQYYKYTDDVELIKSIYNKLTGIIEAYKNGTLYGIMMDTDGLITAGNKDTQLTWMDAKVGNIVPTPRYGKAVEINALWYNALKIMEELSNVIEKDFEKDTSILVKKSFVKFYNNIGLFDTIDPCNSQIRPNQLLTTSLSFPVITGEKAKEVFDVIKEKLYTEKGIKTLHQEDIEYRGRYEGGVYERDISYHQGTAWTWLLGLYKKAYEKIYNEEYKISNIHELLSDRCIGNISEIYDADSPRYAKGAYAQAWSVAAFIK